MWARHMRHVREERARAIEAAEVAEAAARATDASESAAARASMPTLSDTEVSAAATALGVDVATYRLLRDLESREISPEDYDLLGRLDEPVRPATLRPEQLKRFPSEPYAVKPSRQFGVDFWRLPLPVDVEEASTDHGSD